MLDFSSLFSLHFFKQHHVSLSQLKRQANQLPGSKPQFGLWGVD